MLVSQEVPANINVGESRSTRKYVCRPLCRHFVHLSFYNMQQPAGNSGGDSDSDSDGDSKAICAMFLQGKCKKGTKCLDMHLQWENVARAGFCPLHVVGQCPHPCKFGLKHLCTFAYATDKTIKTARGFTTGDGPGKARQRDKRGTAAVGRVLGVLADAPGELR